MGHWETDNVIHKVIFGVELKPLVKISFHFFFGGGVAHVLARLKYSLKIY
jgi:hypothetical protein